MPDIFQVSENLSNINPAQLLQKLLGRSDIQKLMIQLNTENQLNKLNENPFSVKLSKVGGLYSTGYAKSKKTSRNKINLKQSGKYYQTFKVIPLANGNAEITSNNKIHGSDTFLANERWGEVEGLNEKNTLIVLTALDEEILKVILQ